ncbi:hypothetical protein LCGC14_1554630 [marine sediment metagenome]|uniref:Uncharacterized protein n=1 Tax=marine sediment metagenome TaxID=412755 RepID=A0A0F9LQ21_9ZZZZ
MSIIYFILVFTNFPLGYPLISTDYDTGIFLILLAIDLGNLKDILHWRWRWWVR